jgi:hypothetical protein
MESKSRVGTRVSLLGYTCLQSPSPDVIKINWNVRHRLPSYIEDLRLDELIDHHLRLLRMLSVSELALREPVLLYLRER